MKIVTVCGLGVGSSLILRMTAESALSNLGEDADIEHWDMGTVQSQDYDLLITTEEFRDNFQGQDNVIFINNVIDVDEVTEKIKKYLDKV